jgi:hypothetical protein
MAGKPEDDTFSNNSPAPSYLKRGEFTRSGPLGDRTLHNLKDYHSVGPVLRTGLIPRVLLLTGRRWRCRYYLGAINNGNCQDIFLEMP